METRLEQLRKEDERLWDRVKKHDAARSALVAEWSAVRAEYNAEVQREKQESMRAQIRAELAAEKATV